jgi:ribonuclease BN (tRNA processing enzyme)
MKLRVLGMNGPFPAPGGACSGYWLEASGRRFVFDIGSGVFAALIGWMDPSAIDAILITHFHHDHASDLGVLSYYLSLCEPGLAVRVIAPEKHVWANHPSFSFLGDGLVLPDVRITSFRVRHTAPAQAYRVEAAGKVFVYSGDLNTTEGFDAFCQGADLLLCDAALPYAKWTMEAPHLSARHAGEIAVRAGVHQLMITHINPHYPGSLLLKEASDVFSHTVLAQNDMVYEF